MSEEIIDCQEELAELIDDEVSMYFGGTEGDKELAWFITSAITDSYFVLPTMDSVDASMTIYFTQQGMEDLFKFCKDNKFNPHDFIRETLRDAIY
jgi:hypothetical protein